MRERRETVRKEGSLPEELQGELGAGDLLSLSPEKRGLKRLLDELNLYAMPVFTGLDHQTQLKFSKLQEEASLALLGQNVDVKPTEKKVEKFIKEVSDKVKDKGN